MRRWLIILAGIVSTLVMGVLPAVAVPAQASVDAPVGRIGQTLRVQDGELVADVTVVSVTPSPIPPGLGYAPRPPREQLWRAQVVVQAVRVPTPYTMAKSFSFRGVTLTGDAYEPRNTDAPDDLQNGLQNAPQGSTVAGAVFWDCYRDLVAHVVLINKQTGVHLAQWDL
jgi:Domain of unknown function (DUF1942)